jgi:Cu/Ag efflux pump CusA
MCDVERDANVNVRVKPEAKARMLRLAKKMSSDEHLVTLSDVARLSMAKGLPLLEKEAQ